MVHFFLLLIKYKFILLNLLFLKIISSVLMYFMHLFNFLKQLIIELIELINH